MPKTSLFTHARNSHGVIQRIPRAWLEDGSPFASQFTVTPSIRQREERSETPDETWTQKQLRAEAERVGADLSGLTTKAEFASAINHTAHGAEKE